MMKYLIILMFFIGGCASLSIESPDGWKASYDRFLFDQKIDGLKLTKTQNGTVEASLDSQKSDSAILAQTIQTLIKPK